MLELLLLVTAIFCAIQALHAARLLVSAIWLAGVSAIVALLLYLVGAHEVAVIELSVGAGLVTVLFVFAISMAGEDITPLAAIIPRPLALGLVGLAVVLLIVLIVPLGEAVTTSGEASFSTRLWEQRGADVLAQLVLIFSGVLGLLGILADEQRQAGTPLAAEAEEEIESAAEEPQNETILVPELEKEHV